MKLKPIVKSLLDTDLYKLNMQQVMFHKHPNLMGEYYFKCRNKEVIFTQEMLDEINEQIDHLCKLKFTDKELDYLRTIRFLKEDYIQFLRFWKPMRDYVTTNLTDQGELEIKVSGPLFIVSPFEIYLLEIINEVLGSPFASKVKNEPANDQSVNNPPSVLILIRLFLIITQ